MTAPTDVTAYLKDEYKEHLTPKQWDTLVAIKAHGSQRAAAVAMGVHSSAIDCRMTAIRKKLARLGHAPGHWDFGAPPGYTLGKVTRQIKNEDGTFSWPRYIPVNDEEDSLRKYVEELAAPIRGKSPITPAPRHLMSDMLVSYKFGDPHFGMASGPEAGGD